MRCPHKIAILFGLLFALLVAGYAQEPLGDVARKSREKQKAKEAQTARKVVTDEDMPQHPESTADSSAASPSGNIEQPDATASSQPAAAQSADQWEAMIQAQKSSIANLQSQIDKLNDSIHFVQANLYINGVQYNQHQHEKQQQVERMQKQLDGEKQKLEDMQEAARQAGFGSAVYDP
jgi:exonuclease VII small subunit